MADDDRPEPSLELPSFGLGRRRARRRRAPEPDPAPAARPLVVEETAEAAPPASPRSAGGLVAVLATGLLVGALAVGLTRLGQRGCEAVRGTSSCGEPGLLLLLAILTTTVLVGAGALRLAGVPDPGSTSFLAVGLLTVLTLLFLVGSLFEWWVVIVVPLLSGLTFALSHWVTTTFDGGDAPA